MGELRIGRITGGHGIKGWIKVFSHTDPIEAILDYSPWTLKRGNESKSVTILQGQLSGRRLIAQIEGIDTRNDADALKGYEILVKREILPELDSGDYYWYQLEGLKVSNSQGVVFGTVDHLLETGANDVLVIKPTEDSDDDQQRLIPYVEGEVVQKVDLEAGQIVVNWESDY